MHSFDYYYLSAPMQTASNWTQNNAIEGDNPNLTAQFDETPDENTDVAITDTYYTSLCGVDWYRPDPDRPGEYIGDATGMYVCNVKNAAGECAGSTVRYNNHATDLSWYGADFERRLAAHEIGHSLGLWHRAFDLNQPNTHGPMPAEDNYRIDAHYTTHDRSHLAQY